VGQIGSAFNEHIVGGDWDGPFFWQPVNFIKNLSKMAWEVLQENEKFNEMMERLPEGLQDPAKLVAGLVKGGAVLLLTGAIIKVIELAIRGIKIAALGVKLGAILINIIRRAFGHVPKTPGGPAGTGGTGIPVGNMNVNARIVNV